MDVNWMNWKTWAGVGLIIIAAFAIYAFASTHDTTDATVAPQPATSTRSPRLTQPAPGVGVIHTEWLESQSGSYKSERNLFAYKEPPPPPPAPMPKPVPIVPQPPPVPQPPVPVEPPKPVPPQFPYHYIGTFGTASNPIATFSGNGQIINVRVGETIDGKFILRSIGIESVQIGYAGFPPELTTRIPIGQ